MGIKDLNVLHEYIQLLEWIRNWCTKDGVNIGGIKTTRYITGFPLLEVEVEYRKDVVKFLISRASIYILAFHTKKLGWVMFSDIEFDIKIENSTTMARNAVYANVPCETLGIKTMVNAFSAMKSSDASEASLGCEIFVVNIAEACRIKLIELEVSRSMIPCSTTLLPDHDNDEIHLVSDVNCVDIISSLIPIGVDINREEVGGARVKYHIKKWKNLSKAWMSYTLSQKKIVVLSPEIANGCGIKTMRSLRNSLAVLTGTNMDKIVNEWEQKLVRGRCPANFQQIDLDYMKSQVASFKANKSNAKVVEGEGSY